MTEFSFWVNVGKSIYSFLTHSNLQNDLVIIRYASEVQGNGLSGDI